MTGRRGTLAAGLSAAGFAWLLALLAMSMRATGVSADTTAATPLIAMQSTSAASKAPQTPPPATASKPEPAPQATAPAAGYVGDETCLTCHDAQKSVWSTAHGHKLDSRTPAAQHGCETCHGPGQAHVEDDKKGHIRKFSAMEPRAAADVCLTCHTRGAQALWSGSAHDGRNLSCVSCHSVHDPKSQAAQLKLTTQTATCATCHQAQVLKMNRATHMPVREGKMECASCHNPHGSTNVRLLRVGNWINETCVSCHAEKRGPFLYEHAAGRESCVSCHDPHGSSNERMLVAKLPMLCQRCHIGTRHPSTIYDGAQLTARSNRLIGRGCVNCHSNIHGSNHPSGGTFLR
jgi:DmsE family decaheme c-type cytochrome